MWHPGHLTLEFLKIPMKLLLESGRVGPSGVLHLETQNCHPVDQFGDGHLDRSGSSPQGRTHVLGTRQFYQDVGLSCEPAMPKYDPSAISYFNEHGITTHRPADGAAYVDAQTPRA